MWPLKRATVMKKVRVVRLFEHLAKGEPWGTIATILGLQKCRLAFMHARQPPKTVTPIHKNAMPFGVISRQPRISFTSGW